MPSPDNPNVNYVDHTHHWVGIRDAPPTKLERVQRANQKIEKILAAPKQLGVYIQEFIEDYEAALSDPDAGPILHDILNEDEQELMWLMLQSLENTFLTLFDLGKQMGAIEPRATDFKWHHQMEAEGAKWCEVYERWDKMEHPSIPPGWTPPENFEPPKDWAGPPPGWTPQTGFNFGPKRTKENRYPGRE